MIPGITASWTFGTTPPIPTNPFANLTSAYLPFTGPNGSTNMIDLAGNFWTVFGNAQINANTLLLDGTGDYLAGPSNTDHEGFDLQSEDFGIRMYITPNATTQQCIFVSASTGSNGLLIRITSGGGLLIAMLGQTPTVSVAAGALPVGVRKHLEVDRDATSTRVYLDGVLVGSAVHANGGSSVTGFPWIGRYRTTQNDYLNARIDNFEIVRGAVFNTADFTPPSVPYDPPNPFGVWTWFNDPRTIILPGGTMVSGRVTPAGEIASSWSADYLTWTPVLLSAGTGQIDDHNNPGLLRRDDGHIMAFYSHHPDDEYWLAISTNPDDPSAFGTPVNLDSQFGGGPYSYANPYQLTGETNDPIFVFYRSGVSTAWSTYYSRSNDGGTTWAAQTRLLDGAASGRPYFKGVVNGTTRIDFAVTDGSPGSVSTNSIRHFYYEGGSWFQSDGTNIGTPPFDTLTDLTTVYDGASVRAWNWDIQIGSDGHPRILYATFPTTTDHRYHYARWTGSAWVSTEICAAGTYLYAAEPYYSSGMCLDPDDVNVVYASRESAGVRTLWRYVTADNGATWSGTSLGITGIRPFVVDGHMLYLDGRYTTYTDYMTRVKVLEP